MLTLLTQRLGQKERGIDASEADTNWRLLASGDLTPIDVENFTRAARRDLEKSARSYDESSEHDDESVFLRVIRESLWQRLAGDYRPYTSRVERGV